MTSGKQRFIQALQDRGYSDAAAITAHFIDIGAAKFDMLGQLRVTHGAFLDDDVLHRASKELSKTTPCSHSLGCECWKTH